MKNRVCLCGSVYSLFFYLLISSENDIKKTHYFTTTTIPVTIRRRLCNNYEFNTMKISVIRKIFLTIKFSLFRYICFPYLYKADIYAQDHLPMSSFVIGHNNYVFIEDAPRSINVMSKCDMWTKAQDLLQNRKFLFALEHFFISESCGRILGANGLCKALFLSEEDSVSWTEGIPTFYYNLSETWDQSSNIKKKQILDIFDITEMDIRLLSSRKRILFTQPFYDDNQVSLEEHIKIYSELISGFPDSQILIKTHPRDKVDYNQFFGNTLVFNKPVPFQLLSLLGIRFETALTVCSTAINSIPYHIEKIVAGSSVHPNIFKAFG